MRIGKEGRSTSDRKTMKREELEALRAKVSCEAVLEQAGYEIDLKESTRRAVKYRRGGNIVIVTHDGRGWFDPLSDEKGDVFGLAMFLEGISFPSATQAVALLVGYQLSRAAWRSSRSSVPVKDICDRWRSRPTPSPGSGAWRYLCWGRWIPTAIARKAICEGVLREGPFGSMWAAHVDSQGSRRRLGGARSRLAWLCQRGVEGSLPFWTMRCFSSLRYRGRDRRDEPCSDRGLARANSLSQHWRWVVSGDRCGACRTCGAPGPDTGRGPRMPIPKGTSMQNDCGRSPSHPAATGSGYVRRRRIGTRF